MSELRLIWRAQWGARKWASGRRIPNPISGESCAFLHHTESTPPPDDRDAETAAVKSIEAYHVDENGWAAIGYSWLIAPSGRCYQGRGFSFVGAAQAGANTGHGSVAFIGRYDKIQPPWEARKACILLLRELWMPAGGRFIGGHRDVNSTTCPGDSLYQDTIPRVAAYTGLTDIR